MPHMGVHAATKGVAFAGILLAAAADCISPGLNPLSAFSCMVQAPRQVMDTRSTSTLTRGPRCSYKGGGSAPVSPRVREASLDEAKASFQDPAIAATAAPRVK
jgi:hypothetical protein